jgi:hypothetical protein
MYPKGVGNGLEPVNSEMESRRIYPLKNPLAARRAHQSAQFDLPGFIDGVNSGALTAENAG